MFDNLQERAENSDASIYAPERNIIEIAIPGYVQRGSGFDIHFEYEVKVMYLQEVYSALGLTQKKEKLMDFKLETDIKCVTFLQITAGSDTWSVFRRYNRFRELHMDLKTKYPQISALAFPPKKLFGNRYEKIVIERRRFLEVCAVVLF